jgi:hypothetical protein
VSRLTEGPLTLKQNDNLFETIAVDAPEAMKLSDAFGNELVGS